MGKTLKTFFIIAGIAVVLAVCGNMFELRDKNQPRLPIPTEMPGIPHVQLSKNK
jgi:hypothetical protein